MRAETWREADLRGGHGPPPASVTAVVRHAYLALAVARWGESVLFFVAGLCTTMAGAVLSGAGLERWDVWVVGLLGGACAGASWGIEHHERPLGVARRLDRRLRHQGGLLTAYELEREPDRSPMAALVVSRTLRRLRPREAVRALFPPLALPVAAPLVGAALLALALESLRPAASDALDLAQLGQGLVRAVDSAYVDALNADEKGTLDGATAREVMKAVNEIRALERAAAALQERPDEAGERIEELDRRLRELAPRLSGHPDLAASVDEARNWLDAARMALPETAAGGEGLTAGAGDGTMSGSTSGARGPTDPDVPVSESPLPERGDDPAVPDRPVASPVEDPGTTAESWWPRAYDGIVAGWVELRRAAD